jgi:hypothetical protein
VSCYIRHMKDFLADTGLETETKEERKDIDLAIRKVVGKKSSDKCNVVWKEVKTWLENDEKKVKLEYELKTSFNK